MLECCKSELYRHIVGPYEDGKIAENGEVEILGKEEKMGKEEKGKEKY